LRPERVLMPRSRPLRQLAGDPESRHPSSVMSIWSDWSPVSGRAPCRRRRQRKLQPAPAAQHSRSAAECARRSSLHTRAAPWACRAAGRSRRRPAALALPDPQRLSLPVDRPQGQRDDLRRAQAVMRHQMENCVVAPAKPARSVDGAQQALNQRPRQRPRRQFTPIRDAPPARTPDPRPTRPSDEY
jgi:hypothetical protein